MGHPLTIRIIAEAGENHLGDMHRALEMVRLAAANGADFIKFQSFSPDDLNAQADDETRAWVQRVALSEANHQRLFDEAAARGITFLSTAVNVRWAAFLRDLGCHALKLASLSLVNRPLLEFAGTHFDEVFVSTGMGDVEEIGSALEALGPRPRVTVLHCVSEYPLPDTHASLMSIPYMLERFERPTGYSDHTIGTTACIAAAALGAELIEKHFTLDKTLEGTDHILSADPAELAEICQASRRVSVMLGESDKRPGADELKNRDAARRLFVEGT